MNITGNMNHKKIEGKVTPVRQTDISLTRSGYAADAKVTGEALEARVKKVDIVDDLNTDDSNKVLSAKQGLELSKRIKSFYGSNIQMKILNMGDSLFGNYNDETSISHQLSLITGAEVYNCGFGGCQMTSRGDEDWAPFSMCNLADAIASGDFSLQVEKANANVSGMPSYFKDHVNILKELKFDEIDIITIAYGTNDFTDNDFVNTEDGDKYNKHVVKGALRYAIETICTAYPNIRFLICTPMWRCWLIDGTIQYDSDTYKPGDRYLVEYVNGIKEVASEYHLPVCDFYNEMGLNKFNWQIFFDNTDGTHPKKEGRYLMAKKLAKELSGM